MMDYYNTLGVPRDADQETIKKAFRKLAMQHHPDKGGDPDQFQKINEAYETLSNTDKRFRYDNPQARPNTFEGGFPGGFSFNANGFDLNDIFSQVFGQRHNFQQANHRQIYRTQVMVSLIDAYYGNNQMMQLGTPQGQKVVNFKIPKGVESGDQVRYDDIIPDATLMVQYIVQKELNFDRNGADLYSNLQISVLDLIVGTNITFKTITGKMLDVVIPPNTQPTQQIKITGHGMPIGESGHFGDQILLLKPYLPANISQDIVDSIKRSQSNNTI